MGLQLRLVSGRIFPSILFQFMHRFALGLVFVLGTVAIASLFVHGGRFEALIGGSIIGGMIGCLYTLISLLPYELRVGTSDTRACLAHVCGYLVRSKFVRITGENRPELGVGEWTVNRPWWRKCIGGDVQVSVDGTTVVVGGPRSMIKPLWRNFKGPLRKVSEPV